MVCVNLKGGVLAMLDNFGKMHPGHECVIQTVETAALISAHPWAVYDKQFLTPYQGCIDQPRFYLNWICTIWLNTIGMKLMIIAGYYSFIEPAHTQRKAIDHLKDNYVVPGWMVEFVLFWLWYYQPLQSEINNFIPKNPSVFVSIFQSCNQFLVIISHRKSPILSNRMLVHQLQFI